MSKKTAARKSCPHNYMPVMTISEETAMEPMKPMEPMRPMAQPERWWPEDLGEPSSSGSQNDSRYAFFPAKQRLLVERNGKLSIYDSGVHAIGGVAQQQSGSRSLAFTSQDGLVNLDDLKKL
jgi:hypothetical protein